jgi:hypothetical protein
MSGMVEKWTTMRATPLEEARMRGDGIDPQPHMWSYVPLEQRIPGDHPLRALRAMVDVVLQELSPQFDQLYMDDRVSDATVFTKNRERYDRVEEGEGPSAPSSSATDRVIEDRLEEAPPAIVLPAQNDLADGVAALREKEERQVSGGAFTIRERMPVLIDHGAEVTGGDHRRRAITRKLSTR